MKIFEYMSISYKICTSTGWLVFVMVHIEDFVLVLLFDYNKRELVCLWFLLIMIWHVMQHIEKEDLQVKSILRVFFCFLFFFLYLWCVTSKHTSWGQLIFVNYDMTCDAAHWKGGSAGKVNFEGFFLFFVFLSIFVMCHLKTYLLGSVQ